jgi:hypothetical protein
MRGLFAFVLLIASCSSDSSPPPTDEPLTLVTSSTSSPPPRPITPPTAPKVDDAFGIDGYAVRDPIVDGRLSIVPIVALEGTPVATRDVIPLAEAMRRNLASVRRIDDGYDLVVGNHSEHPVLVLAGELVVGGPQDRVFAETLVLAPRRARVVQAHCVEPARRTGPDAYRPSGILADLETRRMSDRRGFDAGVRLRARVARITNRLGLWSATDTYHLPASRLRAKTRASRDRIVAALGALADHDRVVGIAAAIDGTVVAIERFESPALFRSVAPMLVSSYLASATLAPRRDKSTTTNVPTAADVRDVVYDGKTRLGPASTTTLRR